MEITTPTYSSASKESERCAHCGFNDRPTFRIEHRCSYFEVGRPGDMMYSRQRDFDQHVLVCLKCNKVHKILNELL